MLEGNGVNYGHGGIDSHADSPAVGRRAHGYAYPGAICRQDADPIANS